MLSKIMRQPCSLAVVVKCQIKSTQPFESSAELEHRPSVVLRVVLGLTIRFLEVQPYSELRAPRIVPGHWRMALALEVPAEATLVAKASSSLTGTFSVRSRSRRRLSFSFELRR